MKEYFIFKEIKSFNDKVSNKIVKCSNYNKKYKITNSQMVIMEYLIKNRDSDIYQRDLEDVLKLSRATVSSVLGTMEKYELISRIVSDKDVRTRKIILSDKMLDYFNRAKKVFRDIELQVIDGISEEDLNTFIKVIEKMKSNLDK